MGVNFSKLSKNQLHGILDLLSKHKAKSEKSLFEQEKTALKSQGTVTSFDLTNTSALQGN